MRKSLIEALQDDILLQFFLRFGLLLLLFWLFMLFMLLVEIRSVRAEILLTLSFHGGGGCGVQGLLG